MSVFLETVLVEEAINRVITIAPLPLTEPLPLASVAGKSSRKMSWQILISPVLTGPLSMGMQ